MMFFVLAAQLNYEHETVLRRAEITFVTSLPFTILYASAGYYLYMASKYGFNYRMSETDWTRAAGIGVAFSIGLTVYDIINWYVQKKHLEGWYER